MPRLRLGWVLGASLPLVGASWDAGAQSPVPCRDVATSEALVVLAEGETRVLPESALLRTDEPNAHGVHAPCGNAVVEVRGRVQTTGDGARGVEGILHEEPDRKFAFDARDQPLPGNTHVVLEPGSSIHTSGSQAYGIWIKGTDNSVVLSESSIETTGDGGRGIWVWGNDSRVEIADSVIATTGERAGFFYPHGIDLVGDRNVLVLTRSTITTDGARSRAIHARGPFVQDVQQGGQGNEITVTDSRLATAGLGSHAIWARNGLVGFRVIDGRAGIGDANIPIGDRPVTGYGNTVSVAGSRIATTGDQAHGIFTRDNDRDIKVSGHDVTDYGSVVLVSGSQITTAGAGSYGVFAQNNDSNIALSRGQVIRHGDVVTIEGSRVESQGEDAHAIHGEYVNANIVTEPGTVRHGVRFTLTDSVVRALGAGAHGVYVKGDGIAVSIAESRISAGQGAAIRLEGPRNRLQLDTRTTLHGRIEMEAGTSVSIETGAARSVLWDLGEGDVSTAGPVPVFRDPNRPSRIAALDPTGLVAADDALADLTGLMADASAHHRGDNHEVATGVEDGPGASWWVAPLYSERSRNDDDAGLLSSRLVHYGVAIGRATPPGDWGQLGFMLGHVTSRITAGAGPAQSWKNEGQLWFADGSTYWRQGLVYLEAGLGVGVGRHADRRFVNDNSAPALLGQLTEFDSMLLAPRVAVGFHLAVAECWTITPSVRLRHASQWMEGARESGGQAGADAERAKRYLGLLEAGARMTAERRLFGERSLAVHVGILSRTPSDQEVRLTLVGDEQVLAMPSRNHVLAEAGARLRWPLEPGGEIVIVGNGQFLDGGSALQAMGVLRMGF